MLNREKYAADLEKVLVNDNADVKEWLNSEYVAIVDWDKIRVALMLVTGRKSANAPEWKRRIAWRIDICSAQSGMIMVSG